MKTLILCRHAKSSWKYDTDDLYRPLNSRGINQAPLMAQTSDVQPDLVLCSPSVRTWSTAVCYFETCGWDYQSLQMNPNLHEASASELLFQLQQTADTVNTLVMFGHNPGFNDLIELLDKSENCHENLVTSGRVTLELNVESWQELSESCASIIDWQTPADL